MSVNRLEISEERNEMKKEVEKILEHKDPTIEAEHMWNMKTKVLLVIIRATKTI
jgi:hypothetical protein